MIVYWDCRRRPTRRELEALQRAADAGELRSGDVARPGRTNPSSPRRVSKARREYKKFHWGRDSKNTRALRVPDFSTLYALGELVAVEYATRKGKESAIWVHKFSRPRPTLTATPDGRLGPIVGGRAIVTSRGIER